MATAPARPTTLTTKQLAAAVGAAVKAAEAAHKVKFESGLVIGPGTICGPLLRAAADLSVAKVTQIAGEIAAHVGEAHAQATGAATLHLPQVTPGFTAVNHILICGFWPGPVPIVDFGPAAL